MSLKIILRYKYDVTVLPEDDKRHFYITKDPIGQVIQYEGSLEQVKKKICDEIDLAYGKLENLYCGDNDEESFLENR